MNKDSLTPKSWMTTGINLRFVVPVYQRLFTWDTPQFDRLLADLTEWKDALQKKGPYYLGIITVVKREEGVYLLIDGQQRLTVIALLAGLFEWSEAKDQGALKPKDYLDYEARPKDRQALEFIWANGANWLKGNRQEVENAVAGIASESMRKFVLHVFDNKKEWDEIRDSAKERLTLLVSHLPENYSKHIELQNEYFEKMNSAGRQLEPHEILKVRICREEGDFKKWNAVEDFTKAFSQNTAANVVTEVCIKNIISQGVPLAKNGDTITIPNETFQLPARGTKTSFEKWRPALIDFPMFLLHVLKLCENSEKNNSDDNPLGMPSDSHNLLNYFSDIKCNSTKCEDSNENVFVKTMAEYREFLDKWIIHKNIDSKELDESTNDQDFDKNDSRFSYWNSDGNESVWPSPPNQQHRAGEVDDEKKRELNVKLKQVQMALFAIGGQNQSWLCETFLKFRALQESTNDPAGELYSILFNKLIAIAGFDKIKKPNTTNENQGWPCLALRYGEAKPAQFVCLDYFLWLLANSESDSDKKLKTDVFGESSIPEAIVRFIPRANRSVEHFHPQTDNNNSSCHIGPTEDECASRPGWGTDIKDTNVSIKDIFGNLALISAGRNSEYGNFSVNEKSARIKRQEANKTLESIKLWVMARSCKSQDVNWTPTKAKEHATLMRKVIQWGMN